MVFQHVTYEDGRIEWQVCTGDTCVSGPKGEDETGWMELEYNLEELQS